MGKSLLPAVDRRMGMPSIDPSDHPKQFRRKTRIITLR
jgi:hypothetical protein